MDFPECQELWVYTGVLWCALYTACDIIDNRVGSWDWSWWLGRVYTFGHKMAGVIYEGDWVLDTGHFGFYRHTLSIGILCDCSRDQKTCALCGKYEMRIYRTYILIWHIWPKSCCCCHLCSTYAHPPPLSTVKYVYMLAKYDSCVPCKKLFLD